MARSPGKPKKLSRGDRLRAVEQVVRAEGTSRDIQYRLAKRLGVSDRTIRRDINEVLAALRDEGLGTREERRARFLEKLQQAQSDALMEGKFSAGASMMTLEAKLLGLDVPPPEPDAPVEEETDEPPLERLLRDVRRMRRDAESRGSMVAAQKLLDQEHQILRDLAEEERMRREEEARAASDDQVIDAFVDALAGMPDALVERLQGAVAARLGQG